jgi:hypothetical protein
MEFSNEFYISAILSGLIGVFLTLIITNANNFYKFISGFSNLKLINQYKCFYYPWRDDQNNIILEKRYLRFQRGVKYPFKVFEYESFEAKKEELLYYGYGKFERNALYFVLKNKSIDRGNVHFYFPEPTTKRRRTLIGLCLYISQKGKIVSSPIIMSDKIDLRMDEIEDYLRNNVKYTSYTKAFKIIETL